MVLHDNEARLTHWGLVTSYGERDPWVNIGSGNGLLPDGTKPLPEPLLTNYQSCLVTFTPGQFHKKIKITIPNMLSNYHFNITVISSRGQWVNTFHVELLAGM